MGTYTTNYNLFMPTIGEQGWGDLVNGNFTTIDTTMKGLNTRLTAVESEVNGNLSCTSITTSGTITSTGKITANGGIGTKALTATSISNSGTLTQTGASTFTGLITANGGIKGAVTGNATTATNLNRTVTVAASSTTLYSNQGECFMWLPYTPGVLYTGVLKGYVSSKSITFYLLSSANAWSTQTISSTSATTISFSNVKCVYVKGTSYGMTLYLPTFT